MIEVDKQIFQFALRALKLSCADSKRYVLAVHKPDHGFESYVTAGPKGIDSAAGLRYWNFLHINHRDSLFLKRCLIMNDLLQIEEADVEEKYSDAIDERWISK